MSTQIAPASQSFLVTVPLADKPNHKYVFLIAISAAIGGFLFGYDLVIISCANFLLKEKWHLNDFMFGLSTSSANLGCIAGPLVGGWFCDRFGRKNTLFFCGVLFGIGSIGTALPIGVFDFNMYRFIGGIGVGLASLAVPMYLAEIAPTRLRGRIMIMYQLAIVVGATMATLVPYFMAKHMDKSISWRWMFASELAPVVIFMILLSLIPKSPRWLMEVGRDQEALDVLSRINGLTTARQVQSEIKEALQEESGNLNELFLPGMRAALLIGVLLAFFNNWTGWSSIAYYQPFVYQLANIPETDSILYSFYILMVHFALTIVSMATIDKFGRRVLWNLSAAIMIFAMGLVGFIFFKHLPGKPVFFAMILVAIPHALGLGPLPWVMMSEIFPNRIRSKAVGLTTMVLWTGSFLGALLFPIMIGISQRMTDSAAGAFWIFSILSFLALIFGRRMLVETKNRSLEEIAAHWLRQQPLPNRPGS